MKNLDLRLLEDIKPDSDLGKEWEKLVSANSHSGIMQSLYWAHAKRQQGLDTLHLAFFENNNLIAGAIFYTAKKQNGTNILMAPEGPVLPWHNEELSRQLLAQLIDNFDRKNIELPVMALRIEPRIELPIPAYLCEFKRAPVDLVPRETLYIDLSLSPQALLGQMKEKGRYNIKLAERHGITITEDINKNAVDHFYSIMQEASKRDGFALEPKEYFEYLAASLCPNNLARFLFCEHEGDTLGTMLLITYGERATYLYGGIANTKRNLMGGYALQWQAMKLAKQTGCTTYDFYGFDRFRSPDHQYGRFSQFKSQFGGQPITLMGAHEYFYVDNLVDAFVKAVKETELRAEPQPELKAELKTEQQKYLVLA